ncbi:GAF domain-containing protein [Streptomyces sp. NPDC127190]|uniref:GAF domain-containing protein n=1 Tax=unclassified Streptomyces TaxID=2593676 RepID=UPI0036314F8F
MSSYFTCRTLVDLALPGLPTGRLTVLALCGDDDAGAELDAALSATGPTQLVLDLSSLRRLSPAGAALLHRFTAPPGRRLFLAGCTAGVTAVLDRARPLDAAGPELYPTVPDALGAVIGAAAAAGPVAIGPQLRPRALELRHTLAARALVAQAQGLLMERYGLPDAQVADALLRAVGRAHGLAPAGLAVALVHAPPPRPGEPWFPGGRRSDPPPVGFLPPNRSAPAHVPTPASVPPLSRFLAALRDAACAIAHTDMANVQLIDAGDNTLRLESHCGFPAEFVRFFAVIDDTGTACGQAARKRQRVVIEDVATAPVYDEASRAVMLAAHSRSLQCTPIPGPAGRPQGAFSTHHHQPGHTYTEAELGALDTVAREAGAWLDWYRETTVQEALADLHRRAATH